MTPACAETDPELWFDANPVAEARAIAICHSCPMREQCLAGAIERGEEYGTWGGVTFPTRLCRQGHPLVGDNLVLWGGSRRCAQCIAAKAKPRKSDRRRQVTHPTVPSHTPHRTRMSQMLDDGLPVTHIAEVLGVPVDRVRKTQWQRRKRAAA